MVNNFMMIQDFKDFFLDWLNKNIKKEVCKKFKI